jgi:hypothetical protein
MFASPLNWCYHQLGRSPFFVDNFSIYPSTIQRIFKYFCLTLKLEIHNNETLENRG